MSPKPFKLNLPVGTQVVVRNHKDERGSLSEWVGRVGRVVDHQEGSDTYQVKMHDGLILDLKRDQLTIRKHEQAAGLELSSLGYDDYDFFEHVVYRCVVGSRAYGLDNEESDVDIRGIYLAPLELDWSLSGVPEQIQRQDSDECFWELKKFLTLALKANPNILECLFTPVVEKLEDIVKPIIENRALFLSQMVYQTYNGYVMSQFKKLEQDMRVHSDIKWKHAMHLIRLLKAGIKILRDSEVEVRVTQDRDKLLAIKSGEVPWDEVNRWRLDLHKEFDAAFSGTSLPEKPDYRKVNELLVNIRKGQI